MPKHREGKGRNRQEVFNIDTAEFEEIVKLNRQRRIQYYQQQLKRCNSESVRYAVIQEALKRCMMRTWSCKNCDKTGGVENLFYDTDGCPRCPHCHSLQVCGDGFILSRVVVTVPEIKEDEPLGKEGRWEFTVGMNSNGYEFDENSAWLDAVMYLSLDPGEPSTAEFIVEEG